MLSHVPIKHDWCASQSPPVRETYFFCEWLTAPSCQFVQCKDPEPDCCPLRVGRRRVPAGFRLVRRRPGHPGCGCRRGRDRRRHTRSSPRTRPSKDGWRLPLGRAFNLATVSRPLKVSMGAGRFQLDYELVAAQTEPAVSGAGLSQTYLLFGGPGSGKTTLFRQHAHRSARSSGSTGMLAAGSEGRLTEWLARVMAYHNGSDDLTVLSAGATTHAFNVLGATKTSDSRRRQACLPRSWAASSERSSWPVRRRPELDTTPGRPARVVRRCAARHICPVVS